MKPQVLIGEDEGVYVVSKMERVGNECKNSIEVKIKGSLRIVSK